MNYKVYLNGQLYSEFEETQWGYNRAKAEFNNLKRRHSKDGKRVTLCGVFGDILEDMNNPN